MKFLKTTWLAGAAAATLGLGAVSAAHAEDAPAAAAPAGPTPLTFPAMTPPLSANADPYGFDTPVGKIWISGQLTALGLSQSNSIPGDKKSRFDLSNAQVEIQKTDGVFQFAVQAGAYSTPSLGVPYFKASDLPDLTYKAVPVAFIKLVPSANFSVQIGKLPTLIGAEYTFSFQNMNIVRGLLWNQEPAISRGVQANYATGPWAISAAITDGYYSGKYTTGSTLIAYTVGKEDTLAFAGSVQFKKTAVSTFATVPAFNNGDIFNLIWTHIEGNWEVMPYLQYIHSPSSPSVGLPTSGSSFGGAVLAKYNLTPEFSLAGRAEYVTSSGGTSLLFGTGSRAMSLTITPTFQVKTFFIRGELSWTKLDKVAPGSAFGPSGSDDSQTRAVIEAGFLL